MQLWNSTRRSASGALRPLLGVLPLALFLGGPLAHAQDEGDPPDEPPKQEPRKPLKGGKAQPGAEGGGEDGGPERIRPMPMGPGGLPLPGRLPRGEGEGEDGPPPPPPPGADGGPDGEGPRTKVTRGEDAPTGAVASKKVPCVPPTTKVTMDFADSPLSDVVKYMAEITCRNFILGEDLKGQVTIISHQQVTVGEAYEAFLSALEVAGYTTVTVGKSTKIVSTSKAANAPLRVYEGDDIPGTDNFVTQIIELDNVTVSDISTVVKELAGPSARVIAYAPTNTLILTDSAYNIRRVYRIAKQLDVAAPKAKLEVVQLRWATAADVEKILEEVYGVAATSGSTASSGGAATDRAAARRRRTEAAAEPSGASSTNVGAEGAYISKIISDERTNSLILLANEEALVKVKELIAQVDVDIDPASRSQIHVMYLDHASAEEVASVLSSLASGGTGGSRGGTSRTGGTSRSGTQNRSGTQRSTGGSRGGSSGFGGGGSGMGGGPPGMPGGAPGDGIGAGASGGVAAAFEDVRIAADENTNSLVVIAAPEDFRILKGVIDRLDIPRRQVFVEAVVVEVGSEDEFNVGLGVHLGSPTEAGGVMYGSAQLNGSSFGVDTASLLSGLAMGIMGEAIDISVSDGAGGLTSVQVPAFGIALNALASNSAVNIVSNPNLLVVDNEEATINVGRNVPFPVSAGRDNNNNPIVSYQREDVGITLQVTPQINESNYVTLEMSLEVAEVEEDSSGLDVSTAGFITSKRQTENVVVVKDNQTIVIGGLIGTTQTQVETKIPVLGDIPLLGVLFRGKRDTERKTNLLIFLTPHVINEPQDLEEVYRVKWAQRDEFLRRFYGKSRAEQEAALQALLYGSMTFVDQPSPYRLKKPPSEENTGTIDGAVPANGTPPTTPGSTPQPEKEEMKLPYDLDAPAPVPGGTP